MDKLGGGGALKVRFKFKKNKTKKGSLEQSCKATPVKSKNKKRELEMSTMGMCRTNTDLCDRGKVTSCETE